MIDGSSIDWLPAPADDALHLDQLEAEFGRRLPMALESVLRARTPAAAGMSIVHGAEYLWPGCTVALEPAWTALPEAALIETGRDHLAVHGRAGQPRERTRLERREQGLAVRTALVAERALLAELSVEKPGDGAWFSRQQRRHMRVYAELCSPTLYATIESDQLRRLALTDALTGLPNPRALDHALDELALRPDPVSLLFLDADGLGEVNNRAGYDAGNVLIRALAEVLSGCIGEADLAARMGGDEFVAVLFGADGERAATVAAAVEHRFERCSLPDEVAQHSRGVSVGHVQRWPGEHPRELLRRGAETMRATKRRRKSDRDGVWLQPDPVHGGESRSHIDGPS